MPHSTPFRKEQREGSAKRFLYEIKKIIGNKIDLCISLIEQFWCCSTGREIDPARTVEDGQVSKIPPPGPHTPLPPPQLILCINMPICDTIHNALAFFSFHTYKVVLINIFTFIETQALDFPSPVLKGPIGLPSRGMELLAVRRSTSLPKWIDRTALHCTQHTRLGVPKI